ncbi:MAG: hydantoinase/oxoprolinase family protein [Boseongicola sp. SB0662_bin_57]|nr:hydantoinase/oxoprolinase family protein [Boseongicola sp. SB0662_bin_57]
MAWTVGVDVGGTFTDFFAFDEVHGKTVVHKTLSTPENPAEAVTEGLSELCDAEGIDLEEIERFSHGTTVGTNTLIQRKGARVAVVTTRGFRDLLEIGRQVRPRIFSLQEDYPPPLASRRNCFEVTERIGPDGEIIDPLSEAEIAHAIESVLLSDATSCAICLLFSYESDAHEKALAEALKNEIPGLYVSLSSEIYPEIREYERFSTAVLNAYLQPVLDRYMALLEETLSSRIPGAVIGINQSNGGLTSIQQARNHPIKTALSGPAAGVMGALDTATRSGFGDVLTLDMGGTSADVGLIRNGEANVSTSRDVAGFPVRLPMIDIHTVGAGGGSVAWFDRDGLLKVGPISAGADPGPVCYGRGGTQPTVSDANAVVGRLDPSGLLDGTMPLDVEAARAAIQPVAERIGFTVEAAAIGIIDIVVANMARAVRMISVERGYDPRDMALMSFGGAGGLHAVEVARSLGVRRVIVPESPGILCAKGLVVADRKQDLVRSARILVDEGYQDQVYPALAKLEHELLSWYDSERIAESEREQQVTLDMRYVGQNHELRVHQPGSTVRSLPQSDVLKSMFFSEHQRSYGYHNDGDEIEIVNVRLTGIGRRRIEFSGDELKKELWEPEPVSRQLVWFSGNGPEETDVYLRAELAPGQGICGPAIIRQLDSTTVLAPGDRASVDRHLNLDVEVRG